MKPRQPSKATSLAQRLTRPDSRAIDELYGLEPVFEPGQQSIPGLHPEEFVAIQCPWCGERLDARVDLSAGEQSYIEDCEVCCKPMELTVETEDNGSLRALRVQRLG